MNNTKMIFAFAIVGTLFTFALLSPIHAEIYSDYGISVECDITYLKLKPGEQEHVYVSIENISNKTINVEFGQHYGGVAGITYTTSNTTDDYFKLAPGEIKTVVYTITAIEDPSIVGVADWDEQINIHWGVNLTEDNNMVDGRIYITIDIQKDLFWYNYGVTFIASFIIGILILWLIIRRKKGPKKKIPEGDIAYASNEHTE